jgi:hypothetical protein
MTYTHESYLGWRGRNYGAEKVQFKNRIVANDHIVTSLPVSKIPVPLLQSSRQETSTQ